MVSRKQKLIKEYGRRCTRVARRKECSADVLHNAMLHPFFDRAHRELLQELADGLRYVDEILANRLFTVTVGNWTATHDMFMALESANILVGHNMRGVVDRGGFEFDQQQKTYDCFGTSAREFARCGDPWTGQLVKAHRQLGFDEPSDELAVAALITAAKAQVHVDSGTISVISPAGEYEADFFTLDYNRGTEPVINIDESSFDDEWHADTLLLVFRARK